MRSRRWLAIAGLSCALLGAWGAVAFLRETRGGEGGDATADRASAAAKDVDRSRDDSTGGGETSSDASEARELTPTVTAFDPRLEWPDVAALRRIGQRGRALFGGIVYAPDGSVCAGATIFCNRDAIATSDDHGAWRADVSRPAKDDLDGGLEIDPQSAPCFLLAAHKEGVGFAEAPVDSVSRRVDLHLHGGFAFRGSVIDNDDLRPVRGAEIEARVRAIVERVRADARGDFCFPSLPSGNLELSGRAPGYDSNGSFSYNFDRGRDVTITFRLTKAYRLRGQFAPWPAPGVAPAGAHVVVVPRSPHDSSVPTLEGAIRSDGSFDVTLPVCPACRVELVAGSRTAWQIDVDVNEEKHDVDLGLIELDVTAALTGRVAIPDGGVSSAIEVSSAVSMSDRGVWTLAQPVSADGTFRLAALHAGRASVTVVFDGGWIASLRDASGVSAEERDLSSVVLAPGETRDVGVITSTRRFVFGTVRDQRGEPVALAQLRRVPAGSDFAARIRDALAMAVSDEDGHFHFVVGDVSQPSLTIALSCQARGFAPERTDVELVEGVTWNRSDVVLPDGVVLRGTLLDDAGAPLCAASIRAEPAEVTSDLRIGRAAYDITQADGSFEIGGLEACEWKLYAVPRGGPMVRFGKIRPEQGAVTLRMSDGVPVPTISLPR